MGLITLKMIVRATKHATESRELEFILDSGATYSIVPADLLATLGVEPDGEKSFILGDGKKITRKVGEAYFQFWGAGGTSTALFGEPGDANVVGWLTLQALGWVLDPLKRELKPLPMLLM